MAKFIDLDNVMLSQAAHDAWIAMIPHIGEIFIALGVRREEDIPIEQGRIEDDGTLTIFVSLPQGKGEIAMSVPKDQWARKQ